MALRIYSLPTNINYKKCYNSKQTQILLLTMDKHQRSMGNSSLKKQGDKQIYFVSIQSHKYWQSQIRPLLQRLAEQKCDADEIISILINFSQDYCWKRKQFDHHKNKKKNQYQALRQLYEKELPTICKIFSTVLLQMNPDPIPMIMSQKCLKMNYKKKQFIYLLLLMFFSLIPQQYSDRNQLERYFHNKNNFSHILSHSLFKTQCIVQYLLINLKKINQEKDEIFTIIRNAGFSSVNQLIFQNRQKIMSKLTIESNDRSIQQFNGEIKVDFANRFIGGGCLKDGCVQQQIMFAVHPQLYVTTLLCQKMENNQALAFIGFKRYFNHAGYSNTTKYDGIANVNYELTADYQAKEYIAAIDAIKFKQGGKQQYQREFIDREIMKAYLGFSALSVDGKIITGNWGCGVYNGDVQAKLLIQWIAASLAGKQIVFCPFGKKYLLLQHDLLKKLQNNNIEEVYRLLLKTCQRKYYSKQSLYTIAVGIAFGSPQSKM